MDYSTTTEMAILWAISSRRIAALCEQNRIDGAVKKGKTWLIPSDSVKPTDARKKGELKTDVKRRNANLH